MDACGSVVSWLTMWELLSSEHLKYTQKHHLVFCGLYCADLILLLIGSYIGLHMI